MKISYWLSILILLLTTALSSIIAISVNLNEDALGALVNIWLPILLGISSLFIISISYLFIKSDITRRATLSVLAVVILITAIFLRIFYTPFLIQDNERAYNNTALNLPVKNTWSSLNYISDSVTIKNDHDQQKNNVLIFSLLQQKWKKPSVGNAISIYNINHDKVVVRISNAKKNSITITKAKFSHKGLWKICKINNVDIDESIFPIVISANSYADVTIAFTADAINNRVNNWWWNAIFKIQCNLLKLVKNVNYQLPVVTNCLNVNGTLRLYLNDSVNAVKVIHLNSIWQRHGESDWEPDLQHVLSAFNLKTKVGFKYFDSAYHGDRIMPGSDEVHADYFEKFNISLPVTITQIASYHGCCLPGDGDTLKYYYKKDLLLKPLFHNDFRGGQMLLPPVLEATNKKYTLFNPTERFGLKVGSSNTNRKQNFKNKIGVKVWKAIDELGNQIPGSYILGSDYLGTPGTNYDYQDNVYIMENVVPVKG